MFICVTFIYHTCSLALWLEILVNTLSEELSVLPWSKIIPQALHYFAINALTSDCYQIHRRTVISITHSGLEQNWDICINLWPLLNVIKYRRSTCTSFEIIAIPIVTIFVCKYALVSQKFRVTFRILTIRQFEITNVSYHAVICECEQLWIHSTRGRTHAPRGYLPIP
jgi:hypothetical protein